MEIDVPLDRGEPRPPAESRPCSASSTEAAARQRHQARIDCAARFAKFVGKQRNLRFRSVDGAQSSEAERRGGRQPEKAHEAASGQKRRQRGVRDNQHFEPGAAFRFLLKSPFLRAHAEISRLDARGRPACSRARLPDRRPAESADDRTPPPVRGDVGGGPPDAHESRLDVEQRKSARNLTASSARNALASGTSPGVKMMRLHVFNGLRSAAPRPRESGEAP